MFINANVVPSQELELPAGELSKGSAKNPWGDENVHLLPGLPLPPPLRAQERLEDETLIFTG